MTYQLTITDCIKRRIDNAFIPPDEGNTDYQAYLRWLEEGNTPLPAEQPAAADTPEAVPPPELTPAEKLAAAGLSVDELRTLLGLDP